MVTIPTWVQTPTLSRGITTVLITTYYYIYYYQLLPLLFHITTELLLPVTARKIVAHNFSLKYCNYLLLHHYCLLHQLSLHHPISLLQVLLLCHYYIFLRTSHCYEMSH